MKLRLGPLVGAVSEREARIWLRADDAGPARLHVFREGGDEVPGSPFRASAPFDRSGTATIVARLPAAYARYTYDVRDEAGASVLPAWLGTPGFRSAPEPATRGPFRFGLVSCNDLRAKTQRGRRDPERPWRTLHREAARLDLAFLVCAGDQVYADDAWEAEATGRVFVPTLRRAYEDAYQSQWDARWLRRTLASLPCLMTWDDHEIRNGWGSERADGREPTRRAAFAVAREVYRRFQHEHNPPSFGSASDLFYAFRYGDAGVLVLDGRGARDCTLVRDPLLGAQQWRLVSQWLREETPGLGALFVVSSVPPVHVPPALAKAGGAVLSDFRDQWTASANRPELARLASELFDCANRNDLPVVLLSGDTHLGTLAGLYSARPEHARRPWIHQLCASPLTARPPGLVARAIERIARHGFEVARGIHGRMLARPLAERNFGVVDLALESGRYRITLRLFDETGTERATLEV